MALVGNIKSTLKALLPLLEEKTDRRFLDKALEDYREARKGLDDLAKPKRKSAPSPSIWRSRLRRFARRRRDLYLRRRYPHRLGGALSADERQAPPDWVRLTTARWPTPCRRLLAPKRPRQICQVIAMCGDGGFSMLMGDFLSLAQMKLPVKIVIFNNSILGFVAMEMKAGGYLTDGTELHDTNFARIAEACGIKGIRVEKASEVDEALQTAFSTDGPVLVDVVVAKEELAIPPQIKLEQAKGFSLYMLRAIISGRGDEVIELAKTNWLR